MRKILIVDDEILVRVGFRSITDWEAHGYTILGEASDGAEAMELIRAQQPDIVLTDLMMGKMDGFALILACKQEFPQVRFVVLSSYNDFENVKRAMKLGAVDYIFKLTAKPAEILKILDEIPETAPSAPKDEALVRKNLPAIKANLILTAAQKSYLRAASLEAKFREMGLTTDFEKPYRVMYFRNDSLPTLVARGDIPETQLMKYSMGNIIQEVLSSCCPAETYSFTGSDVLSVLAVSTDSAPGEETLGSTFARIYEYIKRYLGIETAAALSGVFCGLDAFSEAVRSCERTLNRQAAAPKGVLQLDSGGCRPEIEQIKQQIKRNIQENFTVPDAAVCCNMSESYFSHLFKKEVGMSFVDYVNLCKIQEAQHLLAETDLRISEIGEKVGVLNPNYFSVLFKKTTGCSPQDYRRAAGS
ncbi:MAG: response regulator [Faecalibacterium sp.]|jgi:two-component system response regulator YesN|nr:response regulator [Faecalibacterium sp.]